MRSRVLARFGAAGLGVLLAFGLAEAGLQVADISPPSKKAHQFLNTVHPLLGWAHIPGKTFVSEGEGEFRIPVQINSQGLRDREHAYAKPKGTARILALGDPFTAALEVDVAEAWHERLEGRLSAATGRHIEVVAAGVGGYGTDQELLYFRHEGYRYSPDLVLLQFFYNDLQDNDTDLGDPGLKDEKPYFTIRGGRLELHNFPYRGFYSGEGLGRLRSSQFFRALRHTMRKYWQRRETDLRCGRTSRVPGRLLMYARRLSREYARAWTLTTLLIQELHREVTARGARLAVVYFPDRRQVLPGAWEETVRCYPELASVEWDLDAPYTAIGAFLRREGIPYLTAGFRAEAQHRAGLYFGNNRHFRPPGHRLAAELIAAWMAEQGKIGP